MAQAYEAYVNSNEALDASVYGENESVDFNLATIQLSIALNQMSEYTGYYGNATSAADGSYSSSIFIENDKMSNVLYTYGIGNYSPYQATTTDGQRAGVQYGAITFLYTGDNDDMACPVGMFANKTAATGTHRTRSIRPSTDGFKLVKLWHGKSTNAEYHTVTSGSSYDVLGYTDNDSTSGHASESSGTTYHYTNTLYCTYSPSSSEYLKTFDSINWLTYTNNSKSATVTQNSNSNNVSVGAPTIAIINYKVLKDKIATVPSYNVTNYKNGGLSSFYSYVDSATFDPNSYFTSSNDYTGCSQAVQTAVENLSNLPTPTQDTDSYATLRTAMDNAQSVYSEVKTNASAYTTASVESFNKLYNNAKSIMSAVYTDGYVQSTNAESAANLLNTDIANVLNPVADTSSLQTAIDSKSTDLNAGIFEKGVQKYTLNSWSTINGAIATAQQSANAIKQSGKFVTADKTLNGVSYQVVTDTVADYSTDLTNAIDELNSNEFESVLNSDYYTSFDKAVEYVSAIDYDKYTNDGKDKVQSAIASAKGTVYASDDALSAYNEKFGTDYNADSKVKISVTSNDIDNATSTLLAAVTDVNNVDNGYVKKFTAEFESINAQTGDTIDESTSYAYYGGDFNFDVELGDGESVVWSITSLDSNGEATSSSKIYNTTNVNIVADSDLYVTAQITKSDESNSSSIKVVVQNIYGKTAKIAYASSASDVTYNSEGVSVAETQIASVDSVPFYTFKSWSKTQSGDTITLRPIYTVAETGYTISVSNGTISGKASLTNDEQTQATAKYDSKVTVSTDVNDFVAWAVLKDGKYQIASYSNEYTFYVAADEKFVPVVKSGNVYTADGVTLTVSNIDSTNSINTDEVLYQKLASKAPFISIMTTTAVDSKARAYVRVTEGSKYSSCEVSVAKGEVTKTAKISNILDSGQFVVSLTASAGNEYKFKAYVNYDLNYNGTSLSLRDASSVATVSL
jgi:hypothetical protein